MAAPSSSDDQNKILLRLTQFLTTFGFPATMVYFAQHFVEEHALISGLLIVCYYFLLTVFNPVKKIVTSLEDRWVVRVTDAIDRRIQRPFVRHQKAYYNYLRAVHEYFEMRGIVNLIIGVRIRLNQGMNVCLCLECV